MQGLEWLRERNITAERMDKVRRLKNISDNLGVSLSQFSIAWCLHNPDVSTAILGASKPEQLAENLGALDCLPKLSAEIIAQTDAILGNKPVLPEY
jgi:aryl-alcohol dehydrogenase-like predicted oxidoreductase